MGVSGTVDSARRNPHVCIVDLCPALPVAGKPQCAVHRGSVRLSKGEAMSTTRCFLCKLRLYEGDWVKRGHTATVVCHAICPPKKPRATRKRDQVKPLWE